MLVAERLAGVRADLKACFVERDRLIDGALIAVLSGQHLLMLGPPGTAKSMLAEAIAARLGAARYFEWLLTKFTTPEEIFGPLDLPALEAGRYERVTAGKLPEAEIVFLDEIFKASSAILNALLTALNERRFHQGTRILDLPLSTLFAASNELPEEDELDALYDRFLLRFTLDYVEQGPSFVRLLELEERPVGARLEPGDLARLRAEVAAVELPRPVIADLATLRERLGEKGVIASDRRYRLSLSVLRAAALLDGRRRVRAGDLAWLEHVLWSDPEDRGTVVEALSALLSGHEEEAATLLGHAKEVHAFARRPWPDAGARTRALLEGHAKLEEILLRLDGFIAGARGRGREVSALNAVREQVAALQAGLLPGDN